MSFSTVLHRRQLYRAALVTALTLVCLSMTNCSRGEPEKATDDRPNVVLILTDDQNYLSVQHMSVLKEKLGKQGIIFTNAIASDPECCPFRSSFLAGGYHPKNTNVKDNSRYGSKKFNDKNTIATQLQSAGYDTGFIGKYKHGYVPGYVPPGWTSFIANNDGGHLQDWMNLRDITYGSSAADATQGRIEKERQQYLTYFHRDMALDFIENHADHPFFLFVSLYAPHAPRIPAPDETKTFPNVALAEIIERDLSDKPRWMQKVAALKNPHDETALIRKTAIALQPVDRMIDEIVEKLTQHGLLDNTYVIFTSDNGIMFGRHGVQPNKGYPYEDGIRVPLIVRGPGVDSGVNDTPVASNLDLPPTILELAGVASESDGLSLLPLLHGEAELERERIYLEYYGYLTDVLNVGLPIVWSGYRTDRYKYIEYANGERELYDFVYDPFEHENVVDDDVYSNVAQEFSEYLSVERGLTLTNLFPPAGIVGEEYKFQLGAIGSTPPYRYYIGEGKLPEGMSLDQRTGLISGMPVRAMGAASVYIEVESDRIARHQGDKEKAYWRYKFKINP